MTDDLLRRAAQAVRETTDSVQPRSGLTRAAILDRAEKRYASRRGFGLRWFIALVAALGASTALARVVQYWPEITRALTHSAPERQPSAARRARPQPTAARSQPAPAPQPTAAGSAAPQAPQAAPAAPAASAPPAPKRRPRPAPQPAAAMEISTPSPAPAPPVESAELVLFRRAQRLHLARDPQAVVAWDDYLRVAGQGALVPEARYNRALCLVRLGRADEARAALEPFARGDFQGYRRTEAAALLEALARGDRKP